MNPKGGTPKVTPITAGLSGGMNPKGTPKDEPHITELHIQQQGESMPLVQIIDLYHEVLPSAPKVRSMSARVQECALLVWSADERHRSLKFWRHLFALCRESDFLRGRVFNDRRGKFELNFYFICNNWAEILNGRYS